MAWSLVAAVSMLIRLTWTTVYRIPRTLMKSPMLLTRNPIMSGRCAHTTRPLQWILHDNCCLANCSRKWFSAVHIVRLRGRRPRLQGLRVRVPLPYSRTQFHLWMWQCARYGPSPMRESGPIFLTVASPQVICLRSRFHRNVNHNL